MTPDAIQQPASNYTKVTASRSRKLCLVLIIGVLYSSLLSCTAPTPKQPLVEAPPPLPAAQTQADQSPQKLTPPDLNRVQDAVRRVFKDTALIDTTREPSFIAGDFNGDLSQDIAVVLKPAAGKLGEINEEYPSWILRDPFKPNEPGMPRPRVAEDEVMLAVIHGYGANGWNDAQATQTFLLKNAVGSTMQAHPGKAFLAANQGKVLPEIQGDLIGEVLKGASGYLYYGGATYSWYEPKTFKGDVRRRMVHSGAGMKTNRKK